jgi:peptidoglycan/LPS O-acetylase OafA/YrhL
MTAPERQTSAAPAIDPSRWVLLSVVLDVVFVVLFTVIGRVSHGEGLAFGGVAQTAWPFLAGTLLGWLVTAAWRRPLAIVRSGIPIWVLTVAVGMVLRVVSSQGIAFSFVVVATIVLGVFLLGWRALVAPIARRAARPKNPIRPARPQR